MGPTSSRTTHRDRRPGDGARRSRRRRRAAGVVLAAVVVAAATTGASAGTDGGVSVETFTVRGVSEPDRAPVDLDVAAYRASATPAPAIMLAHGFGGTRADLDATARSLAEHGYVAVTWTSRGFGASGGRIHLDSRRYEVADARRIVDVLATRPEVTRSATGDPVLGVMGDSYGGALALQLAAVDHRVDAIAPQITWNDLRHALFPQAAGAASPGGASSAGGTTTSAGATLTGLARVDPLNRPGVFKQGWAGVFFNPMSSAAQGRGALGQGGAASALGGSAAPAAGASAADAPAAASDQDRRCGRFALDLCAAYQQVAGGGRPSTALLDLLAESSPATVIGAVRAPTLLVQGEADSLFPLSEADANARGIAAAGTPVAMVWFNGGHDGAASDAENDRVNDLKLAWFDHYLRHVGPAPATDLQVTVPGVTVSSENGRAAPQVRRIAPVPGLAGRPVPARTVALTGPEQVVQAPAGGFPAAVTALPGLGQALAAAAGTGALGGLSALPGQTAQFTSAPLTERLPLVGAGRIRLRVSGSGGPATLFAQLYDVSAQGTAVLPQQLVAPVYLDAVPSDGVEVSVSLPAVVRDVAVGHRLRLVVSTTDQAYALPRQPADYRIALAGDRALTLPTPELTTLAAGGPAELLPWALALLVATAAAVLLVTWVSRRSRRGGAVTTAAVDATGPAGADVPLVIEHLGKRYKDGFRAVSDLSFRVEAGQVLGLLGPNGAGKTTTLRMLMGLITPTEGRILVFGREVGPGAPVLSRVGSFVEGPGFLPHVSGLDNLRLFWAATGRPASDSHLDVALEIAGLGEDVHRRVRTYSQGMRQRLAIAQAMLGLPDLLVLDEPTNGLDPPQIREMREVLARYATTGRTVVVSSHLLAEVEQTCSHVVVMHRGRLVAQGPVAELVGSATSLVLDVDDPARAAELAAGVPGAADVQRTDQGITLSLNGTRRSELLRVLVGAGVGVERMAPQHGLEEAFLTLVHDNRPGGE